MIWTVPGAASPGTGVPLVVTKISILPAPPINMPNRANVTVTVDFDEAMNTSVEPNVTSGLAPNHDNVTFSGNWSNSTSWTGNATYPVTIYDGTHRMKIANARNASGGVVATNLSSPFVVDTEVPASATENLPRFVTIRSFTVNAGVSDRTSGVEKVELWVRKNLSAWTFYGSDNSSPYDWKFTTPTDGYFEFATRALDKAGNWEPVVAANETWTTIDTIPPVSKAGPIGKPVNGWNVTVNATASDANGVILVELWYRLDGGSWVLYDTGQALPWQFDLNVSTTGSGTYELATRAYDRAAIYEGQHEYNDTWAKFDLGLPDTKVNKPYSQYFRSRSVPLTLSFGPDRWMIDHTEIWYNHSAGWKLSGTTAIDAYTFNATEDGIYEFYSRGVSLAGVSEPAPTTNDSWVIVDTVAPTVTGFPKQGSTGAGLRSPIYANFSEPAVLDWQTDISIVPRAYYTVAQSSRGVVITPSVPLTPVTKYVVYVKGFDIAGNPFSYSWSFTTKNAVPAKVQGSYPRQSQKVLSFTRLYLNFTDRMETKATAGSVQVISGTSCTIRDPMWTSDRYLSFRVENATVGSYAIIVNGSIAVSQDGIRLDGNGDGIAGDNYVLAFSVVSPIIPLGSIEGRTVDAQGNSVPSVDIVVTLNGTSVRNATSGAGGEFAILDLPDGRYHVKASKGMFSSVELDVDVQAGKVSTIKIIMQFRSDPGIVGYAALAIVGLVLAVAIVYGLRDILKGKLILFAKKEEDDGETKAEKKAKRKEKVVETTGLKARAVDPTSVTLEWETVECKGYSLYYSTDGKRFEHLVEVPKGMSSYTHEEIKAKGKISYRIDVRSTGKTVSKGGEAQVELPVKKK